MKKPNTLGQLSCITAPFALAIITVLSGCTPQDLEDFNRGVASANQGSATNNARSNTSGLTRRSGRLTLNANGNTLVGTWSATMSQVGELQSMVWTIQGEQMTLRMTGGTTLTGTDSDGTMIANFETRSSGTFTSSQGVSGTFFASGF